MACLVAYLYMLSACDEARTQRLSPTDVPVECQRLRQVGISEGFLIWMLYQGHVAHFQATSQADERTGWVFEPSTVLGDRSALALTQLGELFGGFLLEKLLLSEDSKEFEWAWGLLRVGDCTPRYDAENRVFTWGRQLLKRYHQPSANQELVLVTAEELGWISWFDDPLPRGKNGNPKVRLHDTIKNLNRHQSPHLVKFKGNGTGTRVGWELR